MTNTASSSRLMSRLRSSFSPSAQNVMNQAKVRQPAGSGNTISNNSSNATKTAPAPRPKPKTSQVKTKPQADLSTSDKLDILDKVLTEVEQKVAASKKVAKPDVVPEVQAEPAQPDQPIEAVAQAVPQATLQSTDTLNPAQATTSTKEALDRTSPDAAVVEAGTGLQYVEQEKTPEIPVEVESFLERVEEHQEQAPQEVVIADGDVQVSQAQQYPATPVVVLPITPETEKEGEKKDHHWSIRWLVEWSRKIMKMFTGKVVYREESVETS